jgi:hypothetical protein
MKTNLPIKSSARSGRFKKILVPEETLLEESSVIHERITPVLKAFEQGELTAAEFCSLYVMLVLSYRYPGTWAGAKLSSPLTPRHHLRASLDWLRPYLEPNIKRRLENFSTIGEVLGQFAFRSTPLSVNRSLLEWSNGVYGLELMFKIPGPWEVLNQQKLGQRCVSIILDQQRASRLILGERDALGFTMHDLIHADHFYHNNSCYQGQLGLYGFLYFCMREGHFQELKDNHGFQKEFEYLIADMNAYAIHLLKCLKSAIIYYHPLKEEFFNKWTTTLKLPTDVGIALASLNTKHYTTDQDEILLEYLLSWRNDHQLKLQK